MNVQLCQMYVAGKLAMYDELFKEMKSKTSREQFVRLMMNRQTTDVDQRVLQECKRRIEEKFRIPKHPLLFQRSTVGQWLADVCGEYTTDVLMDFMSISTGLSKERLLQSNIGSTLVTRPHLIYLVERMESSTGKTLQTADKRPLAYLDDMPYLEVVKYFASDSESEDVVQKRREACLDEKYFCGKFRKNALTLYRQFADIDEKISDEELMKRRVSEFPPKGFSSSDWDLPVFWLEDIMKVQLPAVILPDTTVSKMLDMVVSEKLKELYKKQH